MTTSWKLRSWIMTAQFWWTAWFAPSEPSIRMQPGYTGFRLRWWLRLPLGRGLGSSGSSFSGTPGRDIQCRFRPALDAAKPHPQLYELAPTRRDAAILHHEAVCPVLRAVEFSPGELPLAFFGCCRQAVRDPAAKQPPRQG